MPPELQTFLLAMTPVGELRLAIPTGLIGYQLELGTVYVLSVLGNLVPVFFLLLFLKPVSDFLIRNFKVFERFFNWIFERTKRKYGERIEKHNYPLLILLVAIPLPVTGAWTGSLVAFLFGIPFKKAFASIAVGVLIAGVIVSLVSFLGLSIENYFGWQTLIGVLLAALLSWGIFQRRKSKQTKI